MPPKFNLVDSPFIPCSIADRVEWLGLRDTLVRSNEIREIRDSSPLVTLALHRLLLAIVYRATGSPEGTSDWRERWDKGRFDSAAFDTYFDEWSHRFDLFDNERPFYQDVEFDARKRNGVNKLVRDMSGGNNATLFDHTHEGPPPRLAAATMARALIAEQCFALGGGNSELGGNFRNAPAAVAVFVLVRGKNLFETLLLNLIPHGFEYPDYFNSDSNADKPCWESDARPTQCATSATGYLDYLTWQTRSVKLYPDENGGVQFISLSAGRAFIPSGTVFDPMAAYSSPDNNTAFRPVRYSESKDLWRDCFAFFQFSNADATEGIRFRPAQNLLWVRSLKGDLVLPQDQTYSISTFGLCNDEAKVNFWRHETLPLPLDYLTDANLVGDLKRAIALAESIGTIIRFAVATAAKLTLTADPKKSADKNRQRQMVDAIGADALFWSKLERPFREFLVRLPGGLEHRQQQIRGWLVELKSRAKAAYRQAVELPQLDARGQRAAIEGEAQLNRGLAKIEGSSPDLKSPIAEVTA